MYQERNPTYIFTEGSTILLTIGLKIRTQEHQQLTIVLDRFDLVPTPSAHHIHIDAFIIQQLLGIRVLKYNYSILKGKDTR
jgi:hypothetical protein